MLWTCLHLPDFSLQLALRGGVISRPLVITNGGNRPQVLSCNAQAIRYGIRSGMAVSAALALTSQLIEHPRDARAEDEALLNLALWAGQFTPSLSLQPPDGLLLEVEGCIRLFGSLRKLIAHIREGIEALGYRGTLATAPTPAAAWLFARASIATSILDRHELKHALSPLPLALLGQPHETIEKLAQLGVRRIGECLKLPRDGLSRRFGQGLLDEMDRALGKLPDPRKPFHSPASYRGRLPLPAPVIESETLLFALKRLVLELTGFLSPRRTGITRLKLELHHEDCPSTELMLGFSVPTRDSARILQLLRERLSATTLPARVETIALQAEETTSLDSRNLTLFSDEQNDAEERLLLIEHLRARLGMEKIYSVATFPDHRPEYAFRQMEPGKSANHAPPIKRPLWLLKQPKTIVSDGERPRLDGPLILTAGPEKIESGWWNARTRRDYFVARNASGETLWIFRDREASGEWYVHGLFA